MKNYNIESKYRAPITYWHGECVPYYTILNIYIPYTSPLPSQSVNSPYKDRVLMKQGGRCNHELTLSLHLPHCIQYILISQDFPVLYFHALLLQWSGIKKESKYGSVGRSEMILSIMILSFLYRFGPNIEYNQYKGTIVLPPSISKSRPIITECLVPNRFEPRLTSGLLPRLFRHAAGMYLVAPVVPMYRGMIHSFMGRRLKSRTY